MNFIRKSIWFPLCVFLILLGCIVGLTYKKNPYVINIQYQTEMNPDQDGVKKIIVSHINGVRKCTWEDFEYNAEKDRYEYEIQQTDNTYLNFYLNPFETFECNLEYRLKYEDSVVDQNDGMIVTLYRGDKPVQQQVFPLLRIGTNREYQFELYTTPFLLLFFVCYAFWMICALNVVTSKPVLRLIVGGVVTAIWGLIWFICVHANAMIDVVAFYRSIGILLGLLLLAMVWSLIHSSFLEGKVFWKKQGIVLPTVCFYVVTCCVYIPSSLFLSNINEFAVPYYRVVLLFFLYAGISFLILIWLGAKMVKVKGEYAYTLFIFFLTLCFYVQSNFLNPQMPSLLGGTVDWTQFGAAGIYSIIGWGSLCIVMFGLIVLAMWKKVKFEKPIRYLSVLFSLMQICSFVFLIITCPMDENVNKVFEKEGQFAVGDQNIIVFVVDTLQADAVQTYVQNNIAAEEELRDFTLFTNTISGGAPTQYAIPLILTGEEYDPMQRLDEYQTEIWQESYLLQDLQQQNYDVRLYTESGLLAKMPIELVHNLKQTSGNKIGNAGSFLQRMVQLTNLYIMPLQLKGYFWMTTEDLTECVEAMDSTLDPYDCDNMEFYYDFCEKHIQRQYEKAFRFYHIQGVHQPIRHDELFQPIRPEHEINEKNEQRALKAIMMMIQTYTEELRNLGVYDESTIIIMGDHGRHNKQDQEKYPAILVKRAGENHPLQYSDNPVCFRNLVATIGSEVTKDDTKYGPGVFDVDIESDVQRLQTLAPHVLTEYIEYDGEMYKDRDGARFIVDDDGKGNLSYRQWNPHEINKIQYSYGDVIDFALSGSYADKLTERLYSEENGKTASDELTICFELPQEKLGDLELAFTYAGVYNNKQKIRIYANGHKVENVECTTDQIGEKITVVISKDDIKDTSVIIRMVFPNAVTPNQLDRSDEDKRVLSVTFDKMWLTPM